MTNLQAALGVAQMEELEEFIRRKRENYLLYQKLFTEYTAGKLLPFREHTRTNHWFYALEILKDQKNLNLRDVIMELDKLGIQTRPIWGLVHEQKPYQEYIAYQIEKASYYSRCVLNFPCSTQITKDEIRYVAEKIIEVTEAV